MCRRNVLPPWLILLKNIQLRLHRGFKHVAKNVRCLRSYLLQARDLDSKATRFSDPLVSKGESPCAYRTFNRRLERRVESLGIVGVFHVRGLSGKYQPFWISLEPVVWPWCNLAVSQKSPYCATVNSPSPVGLVSRQWDTVDWACVLCDLRVHNDRARRSALSRQCNCPFYSSRADFFWQSITSNRCVNPPTALIWLPATFGFSQS
jgi:hypothetical protein